MTPPAALIAKLHAARTRLILERPFIGTLVMHLPLRADSRTRSFATDARAIHFNPSYLDALSFAETQFLLAHEALHCALLHWRRGQHRVRARWDRACDYTVNQLLIDDGMTAPIEALHNPAYRGLAAEAIYALLDDDTEAAPLDEHWFASGIPDGVSVSPSAGVARAMPTAADDFIAGHAEGFDELASRGDVGTMAELAAAWNQRAASSALEAAQSGRLGPNWQRALPDLIQPRLPWRALLARFVMSVARDDYTFARPGRRSGAALLPGRAGGQANLVLALDTSGSIGQADFAQFIDEIDALKGQIRASVTLLTCDASVSPDAPWRFDAWQPIELPALTGGGGGTRFTPVFEWVESAELRPDALLYFTDAQGEFPLAPPEYPVLWLVKGPDPVPWGERIQLN